MNLPGPLRRLRNGRRFRTSKTTKLSPSGLQRTIVLYEGSSSILDGKRVSTRLLQPVSSQVLAEAERERRGGVKKATLAATREGAAYLYNLRT